MILKESQKVSLSERGALYLINSTLVGKQTAIMRDPSKEFALMHFIA